MNFKHSSFQLPASLVWASTDETVATVSDNGLVTGVAPGTTTITVTTNDGNFSASAEITVSQPDAVHDFSGNKFNIYPNPVKNILTIEGKDIISVEIYNITGTVILRKEQNLNNGINVSGFENGIYLMKIKTSQGAACRKFIKN